MSAAQLIFAFVLCLILHSMLFSTGTHTVDWYQQISDILESSSKVGYGVSASIFYVLALI
jgi:hypothetical protein